MRLAGHCSAHLAGEAVAIKYVGPRLPGDSSGKRRNRFPVQEQVLAGLQIAPVVVGEDLIAFFSSKFADAPAPFACVP